MDPRLPGIDASDEALTEALTARAPGHRWVNRLALETSPYLLQHAHNPVNWFPWGEEALRRARDAGKLLLISVGYSTCHWCHVMERESFEDEEIASFINRHFVPIKVDREERPDVDAIYMNAVLMMSGHGGWPMTVIALADQRPVFAGTYFPARDGDRGARMGFLSLLREIEGRYREAPADFEKVAGNATRHLQPMARPASAVPPAAVLDAFVEDAAARFDARWGGFSEAPKFPRPAQLEALLTVWATTRSDDVATMVTRTLSAMAAGGMHDHVGGGFHRYSVDAFWRVPHFEKMLYDNAQLALVYLDAGVALGRADFHTVTRRTLDYLLREMRDPAGGFYSATDADSLGPQGQKDEGWFFSWTPAELAEVLGAEDAAFAGRLYGVQPSGNFEGRSVLHRAWPAEPEDAAVEARLAVINERLYAARARRPAPSRDDKVIAAWNGLVISALARAGFVLGEARYLVAAGAAASFVLREMRRGDSLLRTYRGGEARHSGVLDDYAFMVQGLLDLFEATGDGAWLIAARQLQTQLDGRFWDAESGGYFLTPSDHEALIARDKPDHDGAEPSGNSVALLNLLRLEQLTDEVGYRLLAEKGLSSFAYNLTQGPATLPKMMVALAWYHAQPLQVVVLGAGREALVEVLRARYVPIAVRVLGPTDVALPLLEGRPAAGEATAYVCRGGACDLPAHAANVLREQLARR